MKGMVMGMVGVGACGTAVVMGGGGAGPNDYVATLSKPPSAVYAAFSNLAPEGETTVPSVDGWGGRFVQRIVKVPNEQVKMEVEVDGEMLISAEVQLAPEGQGTRVAAELDFNAALLNKLMKEHGAEGIPTFAFQEFLLDQVFAQAMGEMTQRIESGEPLLSLAATRARWGSENSRTAASSPGRASGTWEQRQAVRPQMSARPTLDPSESARDHTSPGSGRQDAGW